MIFNRIGIASDHAGAELKSMIIDFLETNGCEVEDFGVSKDNQKSVDYPDFAELVALAMERGTIDGGIGICGTGLGMSIAANKFYGMRATPVWDIYSARMSREHNNSNMLCLGARCLNYHRAIELVQIWMQTPFAADRHKMRLDKISGIEKRNFKIN